MLFQTLDDKQECVGVYIDGEIYYGDVPEGLTGTWSYAPYLDGRDIDYAGLFCGGLDCGHVCPEALKDQWEEKTDKLKAFLRSFQESKVDLHENCFFELVPSRFLLEYCELKNKITQHVLDNYPKPKNYDFMLGITKLANQLRNQKVNLDLSFNAAELRTLLALSGQEQPEQDIHTWNAEHVYNGQVTRDEAKKRIFAWLYNPISKDKLSAGTYDRDSVLDKHWDGEQVRTFYDRIIPADKHHALNYIIQSTTSDTFLRRVLAVNKLLQEKRSKIAFCIHDSLVLDFAHEDREELLSIVKEFSKTDLGTFKVNVQAGKNFGEMKEMKI